MEEDQQISMTCCQQFSYYIKATNQIELFEKNPDFNKLRENDFIFFNKLYKDLNVTLGKSKNCSKMFDLVMGVQQDTELFICNHQNRKIKQEVITQQQVICSEISMHDMIRKYLKEKMQPFQQYLVFINQQFEAICFDKIFLLLLPIFGNYGNTNIEITSPEILKSYSNTLLMNLQSEINKIDQNFFKGLYRIEMMNQVSEQTIRETFNQLFELIQQEVKLESQNDIENQILRLNQLFRNTFNIELRDQGLINDEYTLAAMDTNEIFRRVKIIVRAVVLQDIKNYFKQKVLLLTKEITSS